MEKRQTYKDIEVSGRKFRIGKLDALTGSYLAFKLSGQGLPLAGEIKAGNQDSILAMFGLVIKAIGKQEFFELQTDCLSVVAEITMIGTVETPIPIVMNGILDDSLKTDVQTVIVLTIQSLFFNVTSFFDGDAFGGLSEKLKGLFASVAKT